MSRKMIVALATLAVVSGVFVAIADPAIAAGGGENALPWESPLKMVGDSIRGPVAMTISLIAIVVAGAMLAWGGEINDFAKKIIMLVLVIAIIVGAAGLLQNLFGVSGAVMGQSDAAITAEYHAGANLGRDDGE